MVLPNRFPFQHPASPGGNFPPIAGTPLDEPSGTPGGSTGRPFPVGSVFLSVLSTDPSTLLGYGTWEQIGEGRVLVGQDSGQAEYDTAEETGGSETAGYGGSVGSESSHAHSFADSASSGPSNTVVVQSGAGAGPASGGHTHTVAGTTGTVSHSHSFSGGSLSVVQPYFVVYMWKRTA